MWNLCRYLRSARVRDRPMGNRVHHGDATADRAMSRLRCGVFHRPSEREDATALCRVCGQVPHASLLFQVLD